MVITAEVALQSGGDHLNGGCGRYSIIHDTSRMRVTASI